jgi:hypothetical protein
MTRLSKGSSKPLRPGAQPVCDQFVCTARPYRRYCRSALVSWCNGCNTYTEPYESGLECPGGCERDNWRDCDQRFRITVRRRVLVCSVCRCASMSKAEFEEHNCNDFDY